MEKRALEGVRVAVLAADGFEQIEITWPLRRLRRAGADVRIVSLRPGRIRGMNFLWRGRKLPVDDVVQTARADDYGALLLPGGFVNPDLLRQSERARAFVRRMEELGRPIATLCHGPELLISAGLVAGRTLTSWPGIADDLRNAGGTWVDDGVVRDRNWVSSRGPHDIRAFTEAAIELFAQQAPRAMAPLARRMRWAAWLSRAATAGGLAALGIGGRAALRRLRVQGRPSPAVTAADVVRDVGLATAFGGMLFGKLALDPAVRVLDGERDRGRLVLSAWGRFAVPSGVGLGLATLGWLARRGRLRDRRPGLTRTADLLLGAALATGALNLACAALLARRNPGGVALETGRTGAPGLPAADARLVRAGAVTGFAHAAALAGLIGTTAALHAAE